MIFNSASVPAAIVQCTQRQEVLAEGELELFLRGNNPEEQHPMWNKILYSNYLISL